MNERHICVVLVVAALSVLAHTRQAGAVVFIPWLVSEGGNGHLYAVTDTFGSWSDAEAEAVTLGGHLVTINTAAEQSWLNSTFPFPDQYWIGWYQDFGAPDYAEPDGGWGWISGEPVTYTNWATSFGEPNDGGGQAPERWGAMHVWAESLWNDYHDGTVLYGIVEIPEPATLLLLCTGAMAMGIKR